MFTLSQAALHELLQMQQCRYMQPHGMGNCMHRYHVICWHHTICMAFMLSLVPQPCRILLICTLRCKLLEGSALLSDCPSTHIVAAVLPLLVGPMCMAICSALMRLASQKLQAVVYACLHASIHGTWSTTVWGWITVQEPGRSVDIATCQLVRDIAPSVEASTHHAPSWKQIGQAATLRTTCEQLARTELCQFYLQLQVFLHRPGHLYMMCTSGSRQSAKIT